MKLFTWKTTLSALAISFFGALGLDCYLSWYSIVAFGESSRYPNAYAVSIVGGLVSFVAFVVAVHYYFRFRRENGRWIGILPDAAISIITLPAFGFLIAQFMV